MSRHRTPVAVDVLVATATVATAAATMVAWGGFVESPSTLLVPVITIGGAVVAAGVVARWRRLPAPLVVLLQLALGAVLLLWNITGSPLPTGEALAALRGSMDAAMVSARTYAPPVSIYAPPITPVLVPVGVAVVLSVDVLAGTLRRVPLAGLPLLAAYTVPISLLPGTSTATSFVVAAVGFLAMVYLHESTQIARWGRRLGRLPSEDHARRLAGVDGARGGAARIGAVTTGLAVLLPLTIPTLGLDLLDLGAGGGDGEISINSPVADLRRDLERPDDIALVEVTTDDPDPSYLRISVLNRFTGDEWSSGDRAVPDTNVPDGSLPPPVGLAAGIPRTFHDYRIQVSDQLESTWLPTPFPASAVEAEGDWRYDDDTMDFIAAPDDLTTAGLTYTATGMEPEYDATTLSEADPAPTDVPREVRELPSGLPESITELAEQVTERESSKYEKAVALQQWFREDGGFTYDLEQAPAGDGSETLEAFLDRDTGRVGYCEQFAAAMAVMARAIGIPSRIAVGFLQPDRTGPDQWTYSAHDLHTWPELYFGGSGWVRFEPTPGGRGTESPSYTRQPVEVQDPVDVPGAEGGETEPNQLPRDPGRQLPPEEVDVQPDEPVSSDGTGLGRLLGATALVLVVLAVAAAPALLRRRRRQRRLTGDVEAVWIELRATTRDLGLAWPPGRSPREVRAVVAEHLTTDDATAALGRVVARIERSRYGRASDGTSDGDRDLTADAEAVITGLETAVPSRRRRLATWLPRSVLDRNPPAEAPSADAAEPREQLTMGPR